MRTRCNFMLQYIMYYLFNNVVGSIEFFETYFVLSGVASCLYKNGRTDRSNVIAAPLVYVHVSKRWTETNFIGMLMRL
jgi:hypothetical protein